MEMLREEIRSDQDQYASQFAGVNKILKQKLDLVFFDDEIDQLTEMINALASSKPGDAKIAPIQRKPKEQRQASSMSEEHKLLLE